MAHSVYPQIVHTDPSTLAKQDFASSISPRWCPRCGDHSILSQIQKILPTLGIPKEDFVFISGIGCSSRFPYYMDTYGMHTIHGRAPAFASGVKAQRPDLSVWVITGDGDALSIGGNQFMHALRRNIDLKIVLFNNRIYGLTKGQYSPTSELGTKTKTSPRGSIDYPIEPVRIALGAGATFVARTIDTHLPHIQAMLTRLAQHKGSGILEIYQNCPIFNDGTHAHLMDQQTQPMQLLELAHEQPMLFGKDKEFGVVLDKHMQVQVVDAKKAGANLLHHDEQSDPSAYIATSLLGGPDLPVPIGVFRSVRQPTYDEMLQGQVEAAQASSKRTAQDVLRNR